MNVIFGTVVYQAAYQYCEEFIRSLNSQTTLNYKLLVINDDLSDKQTEQLKQNCNMECIVIQSPKGLSIAELRCYLIFKAKEMNGDLLILGDFDDTFAENRVSNIVQKYKEKEDVGFFFHQLKDFDGKEVFLELPQEINDYKMILEYNFLGLSNTAINLKTLEYDFIQSLCEYKGKIFDWYLYTRLLLQGNVGQLVLDTYTYYRIHDNNIAGINQVDYIYERDIKIEHYKMLMRYQPIFYEMCTEYERININNYKEFIQADKRGFWWNNLQIKERKNV